MGTVAQARRRFARLPHDSQVERVAQHWAQQCSTQRAILLLIPELERGAFLSSGRYNARCCATLTLDGEHPDTWCNAVSGWAMTPSGAIVDLAFRWCILCRSSWEAATHIKLVSELAAEEKRAV
jgi:hypothetical protein